MTLIIIIPAIVICLFAYYAIQAIYLVLTSKNILQRL